MNDYALHQAQVSGSLEGGGFISKLIHNIQARRTVKQLWQMDDHMLRDMGVTREEIAWAASRPFYHNAAMALEERSSTRRRANLCKGF
jgi:uncharacterized protein YjiS (DUF1127 family)